MITTFTGRGLPCFAVAQEQRQNNPAIPFYPLITRFDGASPPPTPGGLRVYVYDCTAHTYAPYTDRTVLLIYIHVLYDCYDVNIRSIKLRLKMFVSLFVIIIIKTW